MRFPQSFLRCNLKLSFFRPGFESRIAEISQVCLRCCIEKTLITDVLITVSSNVMLLKSYEQSCVIDVLVLCTLQSSVPCILSSVAFCNVHQLLQNEAPLMKGEDYICLWYLECNQKLHWFRAEAVLGFPLGSMALPATGSGLCLQQLV